MICIKDPTNYLVLAKRRRAVDKQGEKHAKYSCALFGKRADNVFVSYDNDKIFSISTVIQEHIKPATINGLRWVCLDNFTPRILKELVIELSGLIFSNC